MTRGGLQSEAPAGGQVTAAGKTDPGRVRELNEDYVLLAPELDLFVVADGMGGHASGNIASTLAAKSIRNFFEATHETPLDEPRHPDDGDAPLPARRLTSAIRKANRDVHEISTSHERHKGMGSTVVAIHVVGDMAYIAHVGDSRCYRMRDGELKQISRDHSLHNEALALKPNLSAERLARLPKNVVTRALGMKETVQVELKQEKILPGDLFLLCSDGLSNMVKDEEMVGFLELSDDLREACDLLVAMANDAGGSDNISVVLVRVDTTTVTTVVEADGDLDDFDAPELLAAADAGVAAELQGVLDQVRGASNELQEVRDDAPRWTALPEPSDEPLVPARLLVINDDIADELINLEAALTEQDIARAERRERAPVGLPCCRRCEEPVFPDQDFCIECGAPAV